MGRACATVAWRGCCLRRAAFDPPSDGVARVPAAPTGLCLLPPRRLAFRFPAGMLAATYSRVSGRNHRRQIAHGLFRACGMVMLQVTTHWLTETGSGQNAWDSFGKQGWVNSRER